MKQFRLNGKPYSLPTTWADLTPKQVVALGPYLLIEPGAAGRLAVLRILSPVLTPKVLKRLSEDDRLTLVIETDWLWSAPMAKCPLESFKHAGTEYLLWEPGFENCVAIEYLMAETQFKLFARAKPAPGALELLLATLCRPRKAGLNERDPHWDGDRRERYNNKVAEARAKELAPLPLATKMVVLQYYVASARGFHERYRELYSKPEGGKGRAVASNFGLLGILDDVATEGVFGTFEQACYTQVNTVFFHLLKGHRDAKAQREQD